jgi:hypothetical protein
MAKVQTVHFNQTGQLERRNKHSHKICLQISAQHWEFTELLDTRQYLKVKKSTENSKAGLRR